MVLKAKYTVKTTPPLKEVQKRYRDTIKGITDWDAGVNSLHAKIAVFLDRWVQKNFKSEGGFVGGWAPFKHGGRKVRVGTRKTKTGKTRGVWALDKSAKLLQDTGRLRLSYLPFHGKSYVGIGSELPYSKAHELGVPKRKLPKRRTLPRDHDVADDLMRIYDSHVRKKIDQFWTGKF